MSDTYCIEIVGTQFIVLDPHDEHVGSYPSAEAAIADVQRCKKEDRMYETAKLMVDVAIKAHMQMHGVDRETARYWIFNAAEVTS